MKKKEYKTPIAKCTRTKYESVMGDTISGIVHESYKEEGNSNVSGEDFDFTDGDDGESVAKKHTLIDVWDDGDDGDDGF